jgi:outer membrane murein-binding lipoprotein Lpp
MADWIGGLTERVQVVEEKVDRLSASVEQLSVSHHQLSAKVDQLAASHHQLSAKMDQRFNAVDAALLEQRQYTEFAYGRLEAKMDAGFSRLERKLDQFIEVQLHANQLVDRRLLALEQHRPPDAQP